MHGLMPLGLNVPGPKLGAFGSRVQEISRWRAHYAEAALGRKRSAPWVLNCWTWPKSGSPCPIAPCGRKNAALRKP